LEDLSLFNVQRLLVHKRLAMSWAK